MIGTAIVAVRTPTEIIVGADSKLTTTDGSIPELVCKIYQVGRVFFALAKYAGTRTNGFNVSDVAKEAIKDGGSIADIQTRFHCLIGTPLYRTAQAFKNEDPTGYYECFRDGSILDIVFFGFENQSPVLALSKLTPIFPPYGKTMTVEFHNDMRGEDGDLGCALLGQISAPGTLMKQQPDYVLNIGPAEAVHRLVRLAINECPEWCGEPIDILRVTSKGAEWIQRKQECPDIEPYWQQHQSDSSGEVRKQREKKGGSKSRKKRRR